MQATQTGYAELQELNHSQKGGRVPLFSPGGQSLSANTEHSIKFEEGLVVEHVTSLDHVEQSDWDRLFPGHSENWRYFRVCETTALDAFKLSALLVHKDGKLVGAIPMFEMVYRVDTTLGDSLKSLRDWIARVVPSAICVPIAGLGSPGTEECPIGLDPELKPEQQDAIFRVLMDGFETYAKRKGIKVLALKDVTDRDGRRFSQTLQDRGFTEMASLPIALLQLPFESEQDYLASLKPSMRKDLRRKRNQAKNIEIEVVDSIDGLEDELLQLYQATRGNRKQSYEGFDEVSEDYFTQVINDLGGTARMMLLRLDGNIVAFNLFLQEKHRVIAKFMGMDYRYVRSHSLYFRNWMEMVRYCIANKIPTLQVGQTTYMLKSRLGCKLQRSWIFFKHTGFFLGPVFRTLGPRMALDQSDPGLKELADSAQYLPDGS